MKITRTIPASRILACPADPVVLRMSIRQVGPHAYELRDHDDPAWLPAEMFNSYEAADAAAYRQARASDRPARIRHLVLYQQYDTNGLNLQTLEPSTDARVLAA